MHQLLHKLTSASPASAVAGLFHWLGQRSPIGVYDHSFARWFVPGCAYPLDALLPSCTASSQLAMVIDLDHFLSPADNIHQLASFTV